MKITELRSKTLADLNVELLSLLKTQFGLRMRLATQQLSDTSQIKKVRKSIAQVRTLLKEEVQNDRKSGRK